MSGPLKFVSSIISKKISKIGKRIGREVLNRKGLAIIVMYGGEVPKREKKKVMDSDICHITDVYAVSGSYTSDRTSVPTPLPYMRDLIPPQECSGCERGL